MTRLLTTWASAAVLAITTLAAGSLLDGPDDIQAEQDTALSAQDAAYTAQLTAAQTRRDADRARLESSIESSLNAELQHHSSTWTPAEKARAAQAAHIAALLNAAEQIPPATR
jgi:hypothetical protein